MRLAIAIAMIVAGGVLLIPAITWIRGSWGPVCRRSGCDWSDGEATCPICDVTAAARDRLKRGEGGA